MLQPGNQSSSPFLERQKTSPEWMRDIFRSEGVTPPIYNPEFESVDWENRRRPVTERGTDFTVEPTVIDPSLEPGVFAKIG